MQLNTDNENICSPPDFLIIPSTVEYAGNKKRIAASIDSRSIQPNSTDSCLMSHVHGTYLRYQPLIAKKQITVARSGDDVPLSIIAAARRALSLNSS
eukprot:scaffold75601_cov20-Cyclotella_meneghiniana.AAC.1